MNFSLHSSMILFNVVIIITLRFGDVSVITLYY